MSRQATKKRKVAAKPVHVQCLPRPKNVAYEVANPEHHKVGGMETIDILKAKLSSEELRGFLKGNVIKYLCRAESKGREEDYIKANWYATMLAGVDPR
jgi:hypothetical protein